MNPIIEEQITISTEEIDVRIDKILPSRFPEYSRSYFQWLIEDGSVLFNNVPVKKRDVFSAGSIVSIQFAQTPELSIQKEAIPLSIIYEDSDCIVINKAAGMVVHPAPGAYSGTLVNALLFHCATLSSDVMGVRPGIVHRLDKETSGVIIAAKKDTALACLSLQFAQRTTEKSYLALVIGRPNEGAITAAIGRSAKDRQKMCIRDDGKPAHSEVIVLASTGQVSLCKIKIYTGRTHQIRIHLASIGHPILGDSLYGNTTINQMHKTHRQLLHAHTLTVDHPTTGNRLSFEAPIPEDFLQHTDRLGLSSYIPH